jgi:hypothetical protein
VDPRELRDVPTGKAKLAPPDSLDPLTATTRRMHVTVSTRFLDKLEAARAILSHSHPHGSAEEILEAGLDLLLDRAARRRGQPTVAHGGRQLPPSNEAPAEAADRSGMKRPAPAGSREASAACERGVPARGGACAARGRGHVSARVRRTVWKRDGGQCQWPLHGGGICGSTVRLQIDHVRPRALGGAATVENLRLLCAAHNLEAARRELGDAVVNHFTARRRGRELRAGLGGPAP